MSVETLAQVSQYELERNKPMPNSLHGEIQAQLIFLLRLHYRKQYSASSEMSLNTTPSSTPDICIHQKRKINVYEVQAKETQAPITTIEIQSPSQSIEELIQKARELYFPMGVQSAWIVIPAIRTIQIFTPDEQFTLFTKDKLTDDVTGIELSIDEIFEGVDY